MEFINEKKSGVHVLRMQAPRLDSDLAPLLKTEFLRLFNKKIYNILLDLNAVEYCDSSGLGAILFGVRHANEQGGTMKLVHLNAKILSLIKIAKLDDYIDSFDNETEALQSFADQS